MRFKSRELQEYSFSICTSQRSSKVIIGSGTSCYISSSIYWHDLTCISSDFCERSAGYGAEPVGRQFLCGKSRHGLVCGPTTGCFKAIRWKPQSLSRKPTCHHLYTGIHSTIQTCFRRNTPVNSATATSLLLGAFGQPGLYTA